MAALNPPGSWDDAARSVGAWLETLGVRSEQRRLILVLRILDEAQKRKVKGEPRAVAMETAFEVLEGWAGSIFPEASRERSVVQALVALEGVFPADRAGELILVEPLPKDVVEALRQFSHGGGPEIRRSKMTARGIRYGPMEAIAQETWHRFAWAPIFQALLIWSGVFFLLLFLLGGGRKG